MSGAARTQDANKKLLSPVPLTRSWAAINYFLALSYLVGVKLYPIALVQ